MTKRLHPFLDRSGPIAVAHRGGSLEAEENTLAAFERAVGLGFDYVELDVHLTRDGQVVIHHDQSLARMFGVDREIAQMTAADLAGVQTAKGATVPMLEDLLYAFPELRITIELKSDAVIAPLAELITRHDALDRVCIGSFRPQRTLAARKLLGERLCWSPAHADVARLWANGWGLPLRMDFPVVQVPSHWKGVPVVTQRMMQAAKARGIKVQVWTVNEEPQMQHLLDLGVDGIMTDRPSLLRRVMQDRQNWG